VPVVQSPAAHEQLDAYRLDERCAVDTIAESIARHLYGRSYDALPWEHRRRVVGAARRALREPQGAWRREAWRRGGDPYIAAIAVLEVEDPFNGPGEAVRVYQAAEAEAREVR
jgi:hypothetical protein